MTPGPAPISHLARDWPLTGRSVELDLIASARLDADCPGVVIASGVGFGRSRVAREALAAAESLGDLVYWTRGTRSSATVPLGAFAALIPDEVRSVEPLELIRRSTERLRDRAQGRGVVVAVDDAHLLDPASAALLLHLATAAGAFVIATICVGEPTPDAIDALWKDAGALRMNLSPLSDEAIEQLVGKVLEGPVEQSVIRRVVDSSAGNVLYARELILGAVEEHRLTVEDGMWRLHRRAVSPSLAALITARIGRLDEAQREVVDLLAIGEPLRLAEITGLTDPQALESLEAREMLKIDAGSADAVVALDQPLYGEVARADMPVLRARAICLRLAETVGRRVPLTSDDVLRIVRWRLQAGAEVPTEYLLDAARAANLAIDLDLAADLAQRARDAGLGMPATLLLVRAETLRNNFERAEELLAAAEADAQSTDAELAAGYVAQRVHVLYWSLGRPEDTRAFLERAATWSEDPEWEQRLRPWELVVWDGERGTDLNHDPDGVVDGGVVAHDRSERGLAELARIFGLMAAGQVKQAAAAVRDVRPDAPLGGIEDGFALGLYCVIELEGGEDWPELERYCAELLRDAVRAGNHQAAGLAAFTLAAMQMARGRYLDAKRWVGEAEAQFARQSSFGTEFSVRALTVGLAFFTGDLAGARDALATVRAMLGGQPPSATQIGYFARAEGWGARALSDRAGAQSFLDSAASVNQPNLAARLVYEGLRAGASPATVATELKALSQRCDARLVAAYAGHASALAADDGTALMAAAENFATIGTDVYAMEAAIGAARCFIAQGRQDSGRRAAVRARELYAPDQGSEFPVIDGLDGVTVQLTPREAQIAALAARGMSNQGIAEQLVLSVRSVETYIYRAMQKRGVTNRRDL